MAKSKVFSFLYRQLVKWFVTSVWPWIVENIWPAIRIMLIDIFAQVLNRIRSAFFEWFNRRKNKEEAASKEAAEAEKMAQRAATASEAEKHRAVAQVWRQVAEQFRQQNEELKAKLSEVLDGAKADFCGELDAMDIKNVIQECDDGTLKLHGSGATLALPAPSDQS